MTDVINYRLSHWCHCLVLPQMNQDLKARAAKSVALPSTAYAQPQGGMVYQPPPGH